MVKLTCMKKNNLFLKLISIVLLLIMTCFCFACSQEENSNNSSTDEPPIVEHVHEYSSKLSFDDEKHWFDATCGHRSEKKDVALHDMTSDGCSVCDYKYSKGLEIEITGNYATVISMGTCNDIMVCIPKEYQGYPVKKIESGAFQNESLMEGVVIPKGITKIEGATFASCYKLATIRLPEGITEFGTSAFFDNYSLQYIDFPNSLITFGHGSFYRCSGLKEVIIPNNVTTIGIGSFSGCSGLEKVVLGSSVTTLKERAFTDCKKLKRVVFNDNALTIGEDAFNQAVSFDEVEVPSISSWCLNAFQLSVLTCDHLKFFVNNEEIIHLVIPSGVNKINSYAFRKMRNFKSITIPNTVTKIGDFAFSNCSAVESITYLGTTSEWQQVTKGISWKAMITKTKVVACQDGDVSL